MSDLKPGWYWATHEDGRAQPVQLIHRQNAESLWYMPAADFISDSLEPTLPDGWTLGPHIDDLLRDAARYRWLRQAEWGIRTGKFIWAYGDSENVDTSNRPIVTGEEYDALIDAEIAREEKPSRTP